MGKTTFTPVLKKKYSTDKTGIINIRITQNRISKYESLGISLKERFWNNNGKDIESKLRVNRDFDENHRMSIISTVNLSIDKLKKTHKISGDINITISNKRNSFLSKLDGFIKFLESRMKIGSSKKYKTTRFHILKYLKSIDKSDLTFTELTSLFIENFETYLLNQKISFNTTKNYINCIKRVYTKCVGNGEYTPHLDPFVNFKNKKVIVKKVFLEKKHVEKILRTRFDKSDSLFNVRNYFLFQVFGQGLRVSDLLTLRFSNVIEGNITFNQYKTKKEHTVFLTPVLMWILKDYINSKEVTKIISVKYKYKFNGIDYSEKFEDILTRYNLIVGRYIETPLNKKDERNRTFTDIENLKKIVEQVLSKVSDSIKIELHKYSKEHRNEFIFPIVNPQIFDNVVFNENTNLDKTQYNHLQSRTTVYNKQLKVLQKKCDIDITLTSHIPRHTYTNLMIQNDGDVYEISKSLGHQGINTTDKYISILKGKIENSNKDLGETFTKFL